MFLSKTVLRPNEHRCRLLLTRSRSVTDVVVMVYMRSWRYCTRWCLLYAILMPIERALDYPLLLTIQVAHELLVSDSVMLCVTNYNPIYVTFTRPPCLERVYYSRATSNSADHLQLSTTQIVDIEPQNNKASPRILSISRGHANTPLQGRLMNQSVIERNGIIAGARQERPGVRTPVANRLPHPKTLTSLPYPPETTRLPSGENATELTRPSSACNGPTTV
jgi:hypothetical protein